MTPPAADDGGGAHRLSGGRWAWAFPVLLVVAAASAITTAIRALHDDDDPVARVPPHWHDSQPSEPPVVPPSPAPVVPAAPPRVVVTAAPIDATTRAQLALDAASRLTADLESPTRRFVVQPAGPWIVCLQYPPLTGEDEHKNPDRVANAERLAKRYAAVLTEVHRHFRDLFAERCELPDLTEQGRVLVAVVGWDRASYVEMYRQSCDVDGPSPSATGACDVVCGRLYLYVGDEARTGQDEFPAADGRVQKTSDGMAMAWGAAQLLREYGAIVRGRASAATIGAGAPGDAEDALVPMCPWFERGLAEFLRAVEVDRDHADDSAGATFFHDRLSLELIARVRGSRESGGRDGTRAWAKKWTISDLVEPRDWSDVMRRSGKLHPANPVLMRDLFDARAWGLVHFLWFYDEGRYRARLLDVMETALRGERGRAAFARSLGLGDDADWATLGAEFEWYWDECLRRRVGWQIPESRGRPFNTETDPPTGRYEPPAATESDVPDER